MSRIRFFVLIIAAWVLAACNLNAPQPTPIPTPDVPRAFFNNLENGSSVYEGTDLELDIVAQDDTVGVQKIELYLDGEKFNEGETENGAVPVFRVTMNWVAEGLGRHTLGLLAYRPDGTTSQETIIAITVIARE